MVLRLGAERRAGVVLTILIVAIAYAGFVLPTTPLPRLAIIGPITYFVAILGDLGTALVLITTWRTSPARRSTLVLTLSFTVSAVVMIAAILVLPLLPAEPPVIASTTQAGIWLFIMWHVNAAAGALAYVFMRRNDSAAMPSLRFVIISVTVATAAVIADGVLAFVLSPHLAPLANGADLSGLVSTGVGPATCALLLAAAYGAFRLRAPNLVDRALALSLLALAAGMTLFVAGGHRYTASFYSGRILLLFGAIFVLGSAVQTLVASRSRLAEIEGHLAREVSETTRQAKRIRAVWEIASHVETGTSENFEAILQIATAAMRPGMPIFGSLSHLEGDALVFDATAWSGSKARSLAPASGVFRGRERAVRTIDAEFARGRGPHDDRLERSERADRPRHAV